MYEAVCKLGFEGIVSKRLTSDYRSRPITGLAKNKKSKSTGSYTRCRWNFLGPPDSGHVHCNYRCPLWANSGHFTSQLYRPMQSQLAIKQTGTMLRAISRTGVAGLAQITIQ